MLPPTVPLHPLPPPLQISPRVFENDVAKDCLLPMGITSENVAERYGVTRYAQDAMAVTSHKNAAQARAQGYFDSEIVPTKAVTVVRATLAPQRCAAPRRPARVTHRPPAALSSRLFRTSRATPPATSSSHRTRASARAPPSR